MSLCDLRSGLTTSRGAAATRRANDLWAQGFYPVRWQLNRVAFAPVRSFAAPERAGRLALGEQPEQEGAPAPAQPPRVQTGASPRRTGTGYHRTFSYHFTFHGAAAGFTWNTGIRAFTTPVIPFPFQIDEFHYQINGAVSIGHLTWNCWLTDREHDGAATVLPDSPVLLEQSGLFIAPATADATPFGPQLLHNPGAGRDQALLPSPIATVPQGAGRRLAIGLADHSNQVIAFGIQENLELLLTISELDLTPANARIQVERRPATVTVRRSSSPAQAKAATANFPVRWGSLRPAVTIDRRGEPGVRYGGTVFQQVGGFT